MTSNIESVERFREVGFDGLLGKPFFTQELEMVMNHAMECGWWPEEPTPAMADSELSDRRSGRFVETSASELTAAPKPRVMRVQRLG